MGSPGLSRGGRRPAIPAVDLPVRPACWRLKGGAAWPPHSSQLRVKPGSWLEHMPSQVSSDALTLAAPELSTGG